MAQFLNSFKFVNEKLLIGLFSNFYLQSMKLMAVDYGLIMSIAAYFQIHLLYFDRKRREENSGKFIDYINYV